MSAKDKMIQQQAEEIANKVGFIQFLPIIVALIPVLTNLFQSCTKSNPIASTPQKFVQHRYDDETETYDKKLLRITRDEARKEAKKQGQKISKDEAEKIAIKTLDQTRLAENKVVGICFHK